MKNIRETIFTNTFLILLFSTTAIACNNKDSLESGGKTVIEDQELPALANSIEGKILCGYQGWFNAEGDGANLGWKHYLNHGMFEPGMCSIDLWPDMTEYGANEKFVTPFKHADGSPALVFSSANTKTVDRHFEWMKNYGIDGVFVQRFVTNVKKPDLNKNLNKVYDNCFNASVHQQRLLSVMYDLSGSKSEVVENTKKDWKQLVDKYHINDPKKGNILTFKGKAVVAIWGVGFKDREYTLDDIQELISFFKNDPVYGNCSVLLGVPTGWRTLDRDCINDSKIHELIKMADIVHPWTPGRYNSIGGINEHKEKYTIQDKLWCDNNGLEYMPVVFPGFSWYNLKGGSAPSNAIPRLKGDFLWQQMYNAVSSGVNTIYVAMFDEMDEGTCIFKCSNDPPVGASPFVTYEGLPTDYYLWLTGKAGQMIRKEILLSSVKPIYPGK